MTKRRILWLTLLASVLFVAEARGSADEPRVVLWLGDDPAVVDALRLEAEAAGFVLSLGGAPVGEERSTRLAAARALGRARDADFVAYAERQGSPIVFVLAVDGTIAHAPLSHGRLSQRALALVVMSLVEELRDARAVDSVGHARSDERAASGAEPTPGPAPVVVLELHIGDEVRPEPPIVVVEVPLEEAPEPAIEPETEPAPTEPSPSAASVVEQREPFPSVVFGGDLFPFVGSSSFTRGQAVRRLSLNFVGFDGGLDGFELGAIANLHRGDVRGVQIGGLLNGVGGDVHGVQVSGGGNYAGGDVHGAQLSVINIAGGDVRGAQLSLLNVARGDVRGAQLSLASYAGGDVRGVQVGLVNITKGRVRGLQLGLVNVSRDADFALGLINIVRDGRTQLALLGTDGGLLFADVKHGGRYFHSIYSVGVRPSLDRPTFAAGIGVGARAPLHERVFIDVDLLGHALVDAETTSNAGRVESLSTARDLVGLRITERLGLVFGPTYSVLITPREMRTNGFGLLDARTLHDSLPRDGVRVLGWPGLIVGVQVL